MPELRALLVSPNVGLFDRLRAQLQGHPEVVLQYLGGEPGKVLCTGSDASDVLLLDAPSCTEPPSGVLRRLATIGRASKTLVLAPTCDDAYVADVVQCGGAGCLPLDCGTHDLIRAIEAVHAGELWASRRIVAEALRQAMPAMTTSVVDGCQAKLSERERQIVVWICNGMSNKEIGRTLGISDMTVKTHAHNIFYKLGISGRRELLIADSTARQRLVAAR